MRYDYVLFDLDGTLTDSAPGIANAAAYALSKFGIEISDPHTLYKFVGPPLLDSFERYYGMPEPEARKAIDFFHDYFIEKGMFENEVYPGIPHVLDELRKRGQHLGVATSKPEQFAVQIIEHYGLSQYFDFICGGPMNEDKSGKDGVIKTALTYIAGCPRERVLMVGDREYDVFGAKANSIDCVGALYGYGTEEELLSAGAISLAKTVYDIPACVL